MDKTGNCRGPGQAVSGGKVVACPFCGHEPQDLRDALHPSGIRWREDHGQRHYIGAKDPRDGTPCWEMNCLEHEGGCGASMSGDSREEVLAKWSRRAYATDLAAAIARAEVLASALDHIARVAMSSRQQTKRTQWITARAVSALNGNDDWMAATKPKGYHDALERSAIAAQQAEGGAS